jgi:hypothetical protein
MGPGTVWSPDKRLCRHLGEMCVETFSTAIGEPEDVGDSVGSSSRLVTFIPPTDQRLSLTISLQILKSLIGYVQC